ncbi:YbfB/YjiJ family MFS transporter [Ferrimicrobium acidiphilum]|uniref:YbfB/YjiJ family MFS transporter n=1 Tax=Ferrimicrobium acidiphilum TaxID=121039 RepID=UPI0023F12165|nr:YbfB/YjiJ family MFS transporter [Ferrimicrobium acidiphilum]
MERPKAGLRRIEIRVVLTAFGLSLAAATSLGFARFAYSLLLPTMRLALHWSYFAAGAMNTVNALGYLTGAIFVTRITDRFGNRRSFVLAGGGIVASLALTPASPHLVPLLTLRLVSGFCGAVIFVVGSSLAQQATVGLTRTGAAAILGIYFGGAGLGTAISGAIIPSIHGSPATLWRLDWGVLAVITLVAMVGATYASLQVTDPPVRSSGERHLGHYKALLPALIAYGLFGFGYLAFLTFQVALMGHLGLASSRVVISYLIFGIVAVVSGFVWYRPLAGRHPGRVTALIYFSGALGAALFLVSTTLLVESVAAVLFGLALMSCSTAFGVVTRAVLPPSLQTGAMGVATVAIALGQSLGPLVAGQIADSHLGLTWAVGAGAAVIGLAAIVSLFQRTAAA